MYCEDVNEIIDAFGLLVQKNFGSHTLLSTFVENWSTHMYLSEKEIDLSAYVSQIDLDEFVSSLNSFKSRGLNRASLLYGSPGTGKTTFASELAKKMDTRLLIIESLSLNRIMDAGVQLNVLCDIVKPGIILFDDLDRVNCVEDLFGEIERLNRSKREENIAILASVNKITALPPALRRTGRFDKTIQFILPDAEWRKKILMSHLDTMGIRLMNSYVDLVVKWSEGLSGSDLREVALQISVLGYDRDKISSLCKEILYFKNIGKEEDCEGTGSPVTETEESY